MQEDSGARVKPCYAQLLAICGICPGPGRSSGVSGFKASEFEQKRFLSKIMVQF